MPVDIHPMYGGSLISSQGLAAGGGKKSSQVAENNQDSMPLTFVSEVKRQENFTPMSLNQSFGSASNPIPEAHFLRGSHDIWTGNNDR